jgi:hypothetical protein
VVISTASKIAVTAIKRSSIEAQLQIDCKFKNFTNLSMVVQNV